MAIDPDVVVELNALKTRLDAVEQTSVEHENRLLALEQEEPSAPTANRLLQYPLDGLTVEQEWDGSSRFDQFASDPNTHALFAFRSQAEIDQWTHGNPPNDEVTFDSAKNAAKITLPPGDGANDARLHLGNQLRPTFPGIDKTTGENELSLQWEMLFGPEWLDGIVNKDGGYAFTKAYQIAQSTGDHRGIELQLRFQTNVLYMPGTDATVVAVPTLRVYDTVPHPEIDPIRIPWNGHINPLRTLDEADFQPGGDTICQRTKPDQSLADHLSGSSVNSPFLLRHDKWIRVTISILFDDVQRVKMWMQHEDETQPTLVIANPDDPAKGFCIDTADADSGADRFWVEWDSSQPRAAGDPAVDTWFRNLIVYKKP